MSLPRPIATPHKNELNVGIIGYGNATKVFHIPFIKNCKGLRVHSVVQRAPAPVGRLRSGQTPHVAIEYPDIRHYQQTDELLRDNEVDLVVIATPSPGHYEIVKAALLHDKHGAYERSLGHYCPC